MAVSDTLYNLFSSNCDLLIGALGKGTLKAKQVTAIRKQLTKGKGSSGGGSSSSGGGSRSSGGGGGASSSS